MIDWREVKLFLRVLVTPSFWMRDVPASKEWDRAVRALIASGKISTKKVDGYTISVGQITIWLGNFPYGYGRSYGSGACSFLPTRRTALLLYDAIAAAESSRLLQMIDEVTDE